MGEGRWHPSFCRGCDLSREEVGHISATGLCADCGDRKLVENVNAMRNHAGEPFSRWRRGMAASVGAQLLDERAEET